MHGDPKVKVTRRSVCLPQQVAFTLGSPSATIAVQGYMRAEKAWPVCDHCAKERPQPRDAHLTEHPFPAQSDPQVAFARSFNRRHHRSQRARRRRVIETARTVARASRSWPRSRPTSRSCLGGRAATLRGQLCSGDLFGRRDEAGGLVQELNGLGRACSGGPYRFIVRAKDGSPICDIFRVL